MLKGVISAILLASAVVVLWPAIVKIGKSVKKYFKI